MDEILARHLERHGALVPEVACEIDRRHPVSDVTVAAAGVTVQVENNREVMFTAAGVTVLIRRLAILSAETNTLGSCIAGHGVHLLLPIAALVVLLADTSAIASRPARDASLSIAEAAQRAAVVVGTQPELRHVEPSVVTIHAATRRCIVGALVCGQMGAYLTWNAGFGRWWRPARAATQLAR